MIQTFNVEDTIVAQATARQPGFERGILRLSGPGTLANLDQSFHSANQTGLQSLRRASLVEGSFRCDDFSVDIPVTLLVWPNASSYTRQPAAEIHTLGCQPVLDSLLQQICRQGARLAEPGEFTLRAFLAGRMDLTEAEAVLGVIDAQDSKQLQVALQQLSGGLAKPLSSVRQSLIGTLANLEAGLDFVEEDIDFISREQLLEMIDKSSQALKKLDRQIRRRQDHRSHFRVVLSGRPNAGKSSLFNVLAQTYGTSPQRAIVSTVSGTTTDFVSARIQIGGTDIELIDTAGVENELEDRASLQETHFAVAQGQQAGREQADSADVQVLCVDSSEPLLTWENDLMTCSTPSPILCLTKSDTVTEVQKQPVHAAIRTSAVTAAGIGTLAERISQTIEAVSLSETVAGTAIRCQASVDQALQALARSRELAEQGGGEELIALEIRLALDGIGKITGTIYTDDILDVVFRQFCIGK
ncbi:MAG: tRNA modification GTPase [Planctomycetota bacterium]|nr:tRNA modification GTPase [Planctomycetota bacterium]